MGADQRDYDGEITTSAQRAGVARREIIDHLDAVDFKTATEEDASDLLEIVAMDLREIQYRMERIRVLRNLRDSKRR